MALQNQLGFGSYETAWAWLQKLRRAMVRPDRDLVSGIVELDETFVGGVSAGKRGASTDKVPVQIAVERVRDTKLGRVRFDVASRPGSLQLVDFGCAKPIPIEARKDYVKLAQAIVQRDGATAARCFHELGFRTRDGDPAVLEKLGTNIKAGSLCALGQTAPNPILTTLRYFRSLYPGRDCLEPAETLRQVGLDPNLERPLGKYSQGLRQRTSLARVLLHRPQWCGADGQPRRRRRTRGGGRRRPLGHPFAAGRREGGGTAALGMGP